MLPSGRKTALKNQNFEKKMMSFVTSFMTSSTWPTFFKPGLLHPAKEYLSNRIEFDALVHPRAEIPSI